MIIRNDEKGFTLVETLIALVVLGLGILAVGRMQTDAIRGNSLANDMTEAAYLADSVIENLLSLPDSDPLLTDTGTALNDHETPGHEYVSPVEKDTGVSYRVVWNVDDDTPVDNCKTVRATVLWSRGNVTRSLSMNNRKCR